MDKSNADILTQSRARLRIVMGEKARIWAQVQELKTEFDTKYKALDWEAVVHPRRESAEGILQVMKSISRLLVIGNKTEGVLIHKFKASDSSLPSVARTLKVAERTLLDMERLRASIAQAIYDIDFHRAKARGKKPKNGRG